MTQGGGYFDLFLPRPTKLAERRVARLWCFGSQGRDKGLQSLVSGHLFYWVLAHMGFLVALRGTEVGSWRFFSETSFAGASFHAARAASKRYRSGVGLGIVRWPNPTISGSSFGPSVLLNPKRGKPGTRRPAIKSHPFGKLRRTKINERFAFSSSR